MNPFTLKLKATLQRGGLAFVRYPASMLFALALTVLSIWLIYENPTDNMKLFESLQLIFALGALLGMAFTVISQEIYEQRIWFWNANGLAALVSIGAFFAVYLPKGEQISENAMMRIMAGMAVAFLLFQLVPAMKGKPIDFNRMLFMTIKSFFMAAVYALVLMLGFFFVAFAVESLIYENLTEKIYMYISILCGLVGYAFFLGYFPEFKRQYNPEDEQIEITARQPKFAQVLFQNILIPILAALTLVLLIWSVRMVFTGDWPNYWQIAGIFTAYSLFGILLYFLVSSYESLIVRIYKRVIPIAILVFLAFEVYPIVERIHLYGIKPSEYGLMLVWIYAVVTSILLVRLPVIKNYIPSFIGIALIILFVLPGIGARDFSYMNQTQHLKRTLEANDMLDGDKIIPNSGVTLQDKMRITMATEYLYSESEKEKPTWLATSIHTLYYDFSDVFGFNRVDENQSEEIPVDKDTIAYFLREQSTITLDGYTHYIPLEVITKGNPVIVTSRGEYEFVYDEGNTQNLDSAEYPSIKVYLDGSEILTASFEELAQSLRMKYADRFVVGKTSDHYLDIMVTDMSIEQQTNQIQIRILFSSVLLEKDGIIGNSFYFDGIYFMEKSN